MTVQEKEFNDNEKEKALEAARNAQREAELKAARAEAALEESRKSRETATPAPAPATITEEQWAKAEAETGLTRQQIAANYQLAEAAAARQLSPLKDDLKKAREEAESARREVESYKKRGTEEKVKAEFYDKNPAYTQYRKEIDEYLQDYPEADRQDPEKLKRFLGKAQTFIKGSVGGKVRPNTEGSFSSGRLGGGGGSEERQEETEEDLNLAGLETEEARMFVSKLHRNFHGNENAKKVYKEHEAFDGNGVRVDGSKEFAAIEEAEMKRRMGAAG